MNPTKTKQCNINSRVVVWGNGDCDGICKLQKQAFLASLNHLNECIVLFKCVIMLCKQLCSQNKPGTPHFKMLNKAYCLLGPELHLRKFLLFSHVSLRPNEYAFPSSFDFCKACFVSGSTPALFMSYCLVIMKPFRHCLCQHTACFR